MAPRSVFTAWLAQNIGIDYLRLFPGFLDYSRYQAALPGNKRHPGDDSYAMIAEPVAARDAWRNLH